MTVPTIAAIRGAAVGAGLNLALSTDLRIVAKDAVLRSGFLPIGLHPGGGHFTLVGRQAGREAAVAMGIFSQPVTGERAVQLGLAWEALPEAEVEARALELARLVASDPELSRAAVASFRAQDIPGRAEVARGLAVERAPQMWSLLRSKTVRSG
jgi:enoyl-CoA hydratase